MLRNPSLLAHNPWGLAAALELPRVDTELQQSSSFRIEPIGNLFNRSPDHSAPRTPSVPSLNSDELFELGPDVLPALHQVEEKKASSVAEMATEELIRALDVSYFNRYTTSARNRLAEIASELGRRASADTEQNSTIVSILIQALNYRGQQIRLAAANALARFLNDEEGTRVKQALNQRELKEKKPNVLNAIHTNMPRSESSPLLGRSPSISRHSEDRFRSEHKDSEPSESKADPHFRIGVSGFTESIQFGLTPWIDFTHQFGYDNYQRAMARYTNAFFNAGVENLAYLADDYSGLEIIDVSIPAAPVLEGPGDAQKVTRAHYAEQQPEIDRYIFLQREIRRLEAITSVFLSENWTKLQSGAISPQTYAEQLTPEAAWKQLVILRGWDKRNWQTLTPPQKTNVLLEEPEEKDHYPHYIDPRIEEHALSAQVKTETKALSNIHENQKLEKQYEELETQERSISALKTDLIPDLEKRAEEIEVQQLLSAPEDSDFWSNFFCPITQDVIVQPAVFLQIDPQLHPEIYEEKTIEEWINNHSLHYESPITKTFLNPEYLDEKHSWLRERIAQEIIDRHYFAIERSLILVHQLIAKAEAAQQKGDKVQANQNMDTTRKLIQRAKELRDRLKNPEQYKQTDLQLLEVNNRIAAATRAIHNSSRDNRPQIRFFANPNEVHIAQ